MSEQSLPCEWCRTQLGEVVPYGKTTKAEPSEINDDCWLLELEDLEKDTSKILRKLTLKDRKPKSTKNRFVKGDVLYGKLRPYLNKVAMADADGVCTTEIVPLSGWADLDNRYLFFWLKHPAFLEYVRRVSHGVNMPRLGTKDGVAAPFVLAPLAEQKQIAAKLDELLAQVDTTKARLDAIPAILKRFRRSVLAAAVSGRLTEDWRNQFGVGEKWPRVELQQVCEKHRVITYGVIKLGKEVTDGTPCLRTSNVRRLQFELNGLKRIDPNLSAEYSRTVLRGGEVLVNVRGTLGGVALVDEDMVGWNVSREVAVVPVDATKLSPKLLSFWLASDFSQNWLARVKKGVAYVGINIKDLKALPVGLPTEKEQNEIVRRVDQLFAFADQIEQRVEAAQARVNRLTQSILAKAFRGELTAEWREQHPDLITGENSADALLARIRAERANATKPRRGRRRASA